MVTFQSNKITQSIIKYFNPIPKNLRDSFRNTIARENSMRLIVLSAIYFILNTQMVVFGRSPIAREIDYRNYITIFLLITCIYSIYRLRNPVTQAVKFDHALTSIYCAVIIFASLAASQILLVRIGSMSIFIVTLLATSAFLIRRPLIALATNIGAFFYFTATIDQLTKLSKHIHSIDNTRQMLMPDAVRSELYITELLLITLVSCALSIVMYRFRAKVFMDHKIIEEKNLNLLELTMQDSMTKLLNHKASYDLLAQEIQRTRRYSLSLSVLLIDIDHFKSVNDTYGHQCGDDVIIKISNLLKSTCRETDHVGRYGGEEFLVIMTNTNFEQAIHFSERIRSLVENTDFGDPSPITISGGLCPFTNETAKELIHKTDEALYLSKKNGRNRITHSNK